MEHYSIATVWVQSECIGINDDAHLVANIPGIPLTVLGDSPVATADHLPPPTLPPDSCRRNGGLDMDTSSGVGFEPDSGYTSLQDRE